MCLRKEKKHLKKTAMTTTTKRGKVTGKKIKKAKGSHMTKIVSRGRSYNQRKEERLEFDIISS